MGRECGWGVIAGIDEDRKQMEGAFESSPKIAVSMTELSEFFFQDVYVSQALGLF